MKKLLAFLLPLALTLSLTACVPFQGCWYE